MSSHAATHEHDHHITPPSALIGNLVKLSILMALTIVAAIVDFGHILPVSSQMGSFINNGVALAIACVKAYLVVSIFMGVKWGTKLIKMWALAGFVWLPLLLGIFGDYFTRQWEPVESFTEKKLEFDRRLPDDQPFPSELETGRPRERMNATEESEH